jgi:hypothetical protein
VIDRHAIAGEDRTRRQHVATLRFEDNVPITVAFTYDIGKETEGHYGPQYVRRTQEGDTVYLEPILEKQLIAMNYKRGQLVRLIKSATGSGKDKRVTWSAEWPAKSAERPLAGQPAAPAGNGRAPHYMADVLISCAKAAIDTAREANAYAQKLGYPLALDEDHISAWTSTLYIQISKQANIGMMHRNEEIRDTIRQQTAPLERTPPPPTQNDDEYAEPEQSADIAWGVTDKDVPF